MQESNQPSQQKGAPDSARSDQPPAFNYSKEIAELFYNPYLHTIRSHIDQIASEDTPASLKREYIEDLEFLLAKSEVSTSPEILRELKNLLPFLHDPEVSSAACVMLGHIAQNVAITAEQLVTDGVVRECFILVTNEPSLVNKVVFLLFALSFTLPSFAGDLTKDFSCDFLESLLASPHATESTRRRIEDLVRQISANQT